MNEIIKKNGITYGILFGLFAIAIITFIYVVDLNLVTSYWISGFKAIVYITIIVVVLQKTKKGLNNVLTFKDAFTTFFLTAIIGITLATIFEFLLYNVIDVNARETIKEISIKTMVNMMQKMGAPQTAINDALRDSKAQDTFSIQNQFLGLGISYVVIAIFGLIFAAFFKTPNRQES